MNSSAEKIVLASGSPRRAKILKNLGLEFEVVVPQTEEIHDETDPVRTVLTNAETKLAAVKRDGVVVAADTMVIFEGRLLGKPQDLDEAICYLRALSGKTHFVYTGVAFSNGPSRVEVSSVTFRELDEETIREYVGRTCPLDRAGAYDIDENGDLLVARYCGSYTNIMGLPEELIRDRFGLSK